MKALILIMPMKPNRRKITPVKIKMISGRMTPIRRARKEGVLPLLTTKQVAVSSSAPTTRAASMAMVMRKGRIQATDWNKGDSLATAS